MTETAAAKWYQVDIPTDVALRYETMDISEPRDDIHDFNKLIKLYRRIMVPGKKDPYKTWSGFNQKDSRRVLIKTRRGDDLARIARLPDVTFKEVEPSGFYLISGSTLFEIDWDDEKEWPIIRAKIDETIQKYDPAAQIHGADKLVVIKTFDPDFVKAIEQIDRHVSLVEMPPSTNRHEVDSIFNHHIGLTKTAKRRGCANGRTTPRTIIVTKGLLGKSMKTAKQQVTARKAKPKSTDTKKEIAIIVSASNLEFAARQISKACDKSLDKDRDFIKDTLRAIRMAAINDSNVVSFGAVSLLLNVLKIDNLMNEPRLKAPQAQVSIEAAYSVTVNLLNTIEFLIDKKPDLLNGNQQILREMICNISASTKGVCGIRQPLNSKARQLWIKWKGMCPQQARSLSGTPFNNEASLAEIEQGMRYQDISSIYFFSATRRRSVKRDLTT